MAVRALTSNRLRSGERHRCHCLSISRLVVITRLRLIGRGDGRMKRRIDYRSPNARLRLYLWEDLVYGTLIVFGKIDLDPGKSASTQCVQGVMERKFTKGARRPIFQRT